jgi:hypothetical protein
MGSRFRYYAMSMVRNTKHILIISWTRLIKKRVAIGPPPYLCTCLMLRREEKPYFPLQRYVYIKYNDGCYNWLLYLFVCFSSILINLGSFRLTYYIIFSIHVLYRQKGLKQRMIAGLIVLKRVMQVLINIWLIFIEYVGKACLICTSSTCSETQQGRCLAVLQSPSWRDSWPG